MRHAYLLVHEDIFIQFFTKKFNEVKITENPLPDDVKVVNIIRDSPGYWALILESKSFPEVEENKPLEQISSPIYDRVK